jgi:hypothetical protein
MTKKLLKIVSAAVICILLLSGCKSEYKGLDKPLSVADPLAPVVSDGGLAAKQGEWIYYLNGDNFTRHEGERFSEYSGALCRMKEDGSEMEIVLNKDVSVFNIYNGRIYVCVYEGGSIIASLKVDGTDYKVHKNIDDIYFGGCYGFLDGYIYYTQDYKLYRLDSNGANNTRITDFKVYNLFLSGKYVYFTREIDGSIGNVYKLINGQNNYTEVTNSPAYVLDVKGDTAYYYMLQNGTVYEYDGVSGSARSVIYGGYTDYLFTDEGYYVSYTLENDSAEEGIFFIPFGGGEKKKISDNAASLMVKHGDYVYYVNVMSLNQLFCVKADGTDEKCIAEEFVFSYTALDITDGYLYFLSDSDYDMIYRASLSNGDTECIEYEDIAIVG